MESKYKYIHFVEGLKDEWTIWNNRTGDYLGIVTLDKKWKKWELSLEPQVGFTVDCLLDTVDFIKQLSNSN